MARELTKPYYECHITMVGDRVAIEKAVGICEWSFSAIDKDIVLGEGVKCYATRHFNVDRYQEGEVGAILTATSLALQQCHSFKVIREKVEYVVYDRRL